MMKHVRRRLRERLFQRQGASITALQDTFDAVSRAHGAMTPVYDSLLTKADLALYKVDLREFTRDITTVIIGATMVYTAWAVVLFWQLVAPDVPAEGVLGCVAIGMLAQVPLWIAWWRR
jgi:hypothetical protein